MALKVPTSPSSATSIAYLHPGLRLTRTLTGRLATVGYPVLGLPKHSAEGKRIRTLVKAPDGFSILSCDYSQIELRVAAEISGDSGLRQAFIDGIDIHAMVGERVFKVPISQQDESLHRLPSKAANFGYWMGLMEKGLTEQVQKAGRLDWSANCPGCKFFNSPHDPDCDSANFFREYNEQFPGARQFQQDRKDHAVRTGKGYGIWGEEWYLPGAWSPNDDIREQTLRQAHALPIQSGAQRLIKLAMAAVHTTVLPRLRQHMQIDPILQIHDELLHVVETSAIREAFTAIKQAMESQVRWSVPIVAEAKYGPSWGDQKKLK